MQYQSVTAGTFLERPNRFIAMVDLDGRTERVHVKNTGRAGNCLSPATRSIWHMAPIRTERPDTI